MVEEHGGRAWWKSMVEEHAAWLSPAVLQTDFTEGVDVPCLQLERV
jgi:hypothetical protein